MSDKTKKILKILGIGVIWVYVLSIRVSGHTLFYYANDILVQNQIVEAIDQTLADGYHSLANKMTLSINGLKGGEKTF